MIEENGVKILEEEFFYDDEVDEYEQAINSWVTIDKKKYFLGVKPVDKIPSGLYSTTYSDQYGYELTELEYKREDYLSLPSLPVDAIKEDFTSFWDSLDKFKKYGLKAKRGIILHGDPGCHAKGTSILMHDGTIKNVEDVIVGDYLKGPEGSPREVLKLVRGNEQMIEIVPDVGEPFVVNKNHILHLSKLDKFSRKRVFQNITAEEVANKIYESGYNEFTLNKVESNLDGEIFLENISFTYRRLGNDDYYGFTISDDHLYLTSDGIIHHNCGKTSLIYLLLDEIKKRDGIAVNITHPAMWISISSMIRKIEPNRPVLGIIEDIDLMIAKYQEEEFLAFLDGLASIENILFVATTNNIEKIPGRIKDRPSRFDKTYKIKKPNDEDRRHYFNNIIRNEDKKIHDIDKLVKDTNYFSMAHLKEVFISLYILGNDYDSTLTRLKNSKISDNPIGFNLLND
jgi:hypothetical protein